MYNNCNWSQEYERLVRYNKYVESLIYDLNPTHPDIKLTYTIQTSHGSITPTFLSNANGKRMSVFFSFGKMLKSSFIAILLNVSKKVSNVCSIHLVSFLRKVNVVCVQLLGMWMCMGRAQRLHAAV